MQLKLLWYFLEGFRKIEIQVDQSCFTTLITFCIFIIPVVPGTLQFLHNYF